MVLVLMILTVMNYVEAFSAPKRFSTGVKLNHFTQSTPYVIAGQKDGSFRHRLSLQMKAPSVQSRNVIDGMLHLDATVSKILISYLLSTPVAKKLSLMTPPFFKTFFASIYPGDLFLFLFFRLTYRKLLKFAHKSQKVVWQLLQLGTPYEWKKSILGFTEERCGLLVRIIGANYVAKLACVLLVSPKCFILQWGNTVI